MSTSTQLPTRSPASAPELLHGKPRLLAWHPPDHERDDPARAWERLEVGAALALTLAVLCIRLWMANRLRFCGTPDSCFYLGLAQGLERTGSFRVHFVYDLLLPHLALPNGGIEYWRPGTSLLLLPAPLLGGVTLFRGALMASFAGVAWAAVAWFVAKRQPATRSLALPSYALALLLPAAWTGSLTPDSTLFYAAAVAWFLALFTVRQSSRRRDALALVCVSVAYLIRNDATLLIAPLITVLGLRRLRRFSLEPAARRGSSARYALTMLGGFALALLPMHLIYRAVLGTAFPQGTSQVLWMANLSDFNLYGVTLTPATLLAHGLGTLLRARAETLLLIAYRGAVVLVGYTALLFVPAALWACREAPGTAQAGTSRSRRVPLQELAGPLAFAVVSLLVYSLVLPAIGVFSALRTLVGVLPWVAVLSVAGLARAVPDRRLRRTVCAVLLGSYAIGGATQAHRELLAMNALGDRDRREAAALIALGATPGASPGEGPGEAPGSGPENGPGTTVVMTPDPVQFAVTTGFAAVPLPGNGLDAAGAEARDLRVTHVILDGNPGQDASPALNEDQRPIRADQAARIFGAVRRVRLPEKAGELLVLDRSSR